MPLINVKISKDLTKSDFNELLPALSKIVAECTNKPEQYVMAIIERTDMMMSGNQDSCAFATVKSIGNLSREVNENISCRVSELLEQKLNIQKDRVYLNFIEVERKDWGYNGKTFA